MWFDAVLGGCAVVFLAGNCAKFAYRRGWKTLGRLILLLRWPLLGVTVWTVIGKAHHYSQATMAWHDLWVIVGGVTGQLTYVLVKATYRTYRILRARRANVSS